MNITRNPELILKQRLEQLKTEEQEEIDFQERIMEYLGIQEEELIEMRQAHLEWLNEEID